MVVLGLRCFAWAFSSRSERVLLFSRGSWASHCGGSSCCRAQAVEHGVSSCGVVPRHVESSQTRDWTHVPCIGRWTPRHWTMGKSQLCFFFFFGTPCSLWDLGSLTRDWTCTLSSENSGLPGNSPLTFCRCLFYSSHLPGHPIHSPTPDSLSCFYFLHSTNQSLMWCNLYFFICSWSIFPQSGCKLFDKMGLFFFNCGKIRHNIKFTILKDTV